MIQYFYVPKGETDIQMVYNGMSSGLHECLYSPHFGLPTVSDMLRSLLPGYHQADINIAEMFLNFIFGEKNCILIKKSTCDTSVRSTKT